jgi:hypothetical protein
MTDYNEYETVLAHRASFNFDDGTFGELPPPVQKPGEAPAAFKTRSDAARASKKRAARVAILPKGTFVLLCVVVQDEPWEGGTFALATSQDDARPESLVKVDGQVAHIVPAVGSDTELWLHRDGEPKKGRTTIVIAYVKAHPAVLAAAPATEYPKWIGAGHDGVVVKSKVEEDALLKSLGAAPGAKPAAPPAPPKAPAPPPPAPAVAPSTGPGAPAAV